MVAKNEFRYESRPSLGRVDNVPIPSPEILNYAKNHEIVEFKGITLHVLTTLVVADTIVRAVQRINERKPREEQFDINPDLIFETMVAYHSAKPYVEEKKPAQAIRKYMEAGHTDLDFAIVLAAAEHLPLSVIQEIQSLQVERGFPELTVGPSNKNRLGTIEWNATINQLASWSVAGTITTIDNRFVDLIRRHGDMAKESPKKLTTEELLRFKAWGKERIADIARYVGFDPEDFTGFLKAKLFEGVPDAQQKSDDLIRELFNREPTKDEFLPVSPAYQTLATTIMGMDNPKQRKHIERMLENPEEYLRIVKRFGLIQGDNSNSFKTRE